MRGLTFCDISPFYCEKGGGIRTYHRAKIEWFLGQDRHRYVLVYPGPRRAISTLGPTVTLHQFYGPRLTRSADGYRLPLDGREIWRTVQRLAPDVLELDDPWFSGPLGLLLRRFGGSMRVAASFYHSDPIETYVAPTLSRGRKALAARRRTLAAIERAFFRLQASYDVTVVASRAMEQRLNDRGVRKTLHAPFGVDPRLFDIRRAPQRTDHPVRLLYAGRLHADKDVHLLLEAVPPLLARGNVRISVAGTGPLVTAFAHLSHPHFRYLGFVADAAEMAAIYEAHDVLLAPGRNETFGLAALEAAAAGLAVVGPDTGGTAALLRDMASPFIFAAGDLQSFLDTVVAAIESERGPVVARQRMVAHEFGSWTDAIGRLVCGYEEVVTRKSDVRTPESGVAGDTGFTTPDARV